MPKAHDLLGTIGKDEGYEELLEHTVELQISGMKLQVLNLESLIAIKEEVGHEKDMLTIPILRRTLEEKANK